MNIAITFLMQSVKRFKKMSGLPPYGYKEKLAVGKEIHSTVLAAGLLRCMKAKGDIERNNGQLALVLTQQAYTGSTAVTPPPYPTHPTPPPTPCPI